MKDYPYKARENMVPLNVLKVQKVEHFEVMHKKIGEIFRSEMDEEDVIIEFKSNYFSD